MEKGIGGVGGSGGDGGEVGGAGVEGVVGEMTGEMTGEGGVYTQLLVETSCRGCAAGIVVTSDS
jgi:hypothetical protein